MWSANEVKHPPLPKECLTCLCYTSIMRFLLRLFGYASLRIPNIYSGVFYIGRVAGSSFEAIQPDSMPTLNSVRVEDAFGELAIKKVPKWRSHHQQRNFNYLSSTLCKDICCNATTEYIFTSKVTGVWFTNQIIFQNNPASYPPRLLTV
jgi:hypothetical protein